MFFILIFSIGESLAATPKVENIFSDISADYKYLDELQILYDRGTISPDNDGKFRPLKLLTRDEFVGILTEVSCKKCIKPHTALELLKKYQTESAPFFDVKKDNKYYYCIADATENKYISGYYPGESCEDGTQSEGEKPFCTNNTIILEEALAILLRSSNILSNTEAERVRGEIYTGKITASLSDDVAPKNIDGSVYSFYPDFQKALEYEVVDYDNKGNKKTYTLVEKVNNKLRPKKSITREDFLRMASVALKANSCREPEPENIAINMQIFDTSCSEDKKNCLLSDLDNKKAIYDFTGNIVSVCEEGIDDPAGYIWRFYHIDSGEEIIKYGKYINDFTIQTPGSWKVFLKVLDNCGETSEVSTDLNISRDERDTFFLQVESEIDTDPERLAATFEGAIDGGTGPYIYNWDFGDGKKGVGQNTLHEYEQAGTYNVIMEVTDANGVKKKVFTQVIVGSENNENGGGSNENDFEIELEVFRGLNGIFDFEGIVYGGTAPYTYTWDFGDGNTGSGKNTNHKYSKDGTYTVSLTVIDADGNQVVTTTTIYIENSVGVGPSVQIDASTLSGNGPLEIEFDALVSGGKGPYTYEWDFGNGNTGFGKTLEELFDESGFYEVGIVVTDSNGDTAYTSVIVQIGEIVLENSDIDNDGVNDTNDLCPQVEGEPSNNGCPILDTSCTSTSDCNSGFTCDINNSVCIPQDIQQSCVYGGDDSVFGNAICLTCPCEYKLDFLAGLRKCDIIFPAITSPDDTEIYSKGKNFRIE